MSSAANVLTVSRLLAAPAFSWCVWQAGHGRPTAGLVAASLFAFAVWSDVIDGRWARRVREDSSYGRWLDHGADIAFLTTGFGTYVVMGVAPWWVPASILFAFSAYVLRTCRGQPIQVRATLADRIGHWGGVGNYVLLGVLVANFSLALGWLPTSVVHMLFVAVPVYSTAPLWMMGWVGRSSVAQGPSR